jgi:hypothetical protein
MTDKKFQPSQNNSKAGSEPTGAQDQMASS